MLERWAKVSTVAALAIAATLPALAYAHSRSLGAEGYRDSPLIAVEVALVLAAALALLPQLVAALVLARQRRLGWAVAAGLALLVLPPCVALAFVLDAPTLLYAT